jgi:hypothetical protein
VQRCSAEVLAPTWLVMAPKLTGTGPRLPIETMSL